MALLNNYLKVLKAVVILENAVNLNLERIENNVGIMETVIIQDRIDAKESATILVNACNYNIQFKSIL